MVASIFDGDSEVIDKFFYFKDERWNTFKSNFNLEILEIVYLAILYQNSTFYPINLN